MNKNVQFSFEEAVEGDEAQKVRNEMQQYRMANDIEGSGMFFEEAAQSFYDREKVPYTIALYRRSIESYQYAKNERKRKDISQRVAMIYLQLGEKYDKQKQTELARSNYYHATVLFDKADDFNSARDTANKAINTYSVSEGDDSSFFHKLIPILETKVVEPPSDS